MDLVGHLVKAMEPGTFNTAKSIIVYECAIAAILKSLSIPITRNISESPEID